MPIDAQIAEIVGELDFDPEALHAGGVIVLVPRERQHQLWHARGQRFGRGPDAAVMHHCGAVREQLAKRRKRAMVGKRRQRGRQLRPILRQKKAARPEPFAGCQRGPE